MRCRGLGRWGIAKARFGALVVIAATASGAPAEELEGEAPIEALRGWRLQSLLPPRRDGLGQDDRVGRASATPGGRGAAERSSQRPDGAARLQVFRRWTGYKPWMKLRSTFVFRTTPGSRCHGL
jgi:hypothetical protein